MYIKIYKHTVHMNVIARKKTIKAIYSYLVVGADLN